MTQTTQTVSPARRRVAKPRPWYLRGISTRTLVVSFFAVAVPGAALAGAIVNRWVF